MLFIHGMGYLAGFDYPMVVGLESLVEAVEEKGFVVYQVGDCKDWAPVLFPTPSRCGDTWDWIAHVARTGPTEELELPGRVKWIQETWMMWDPAGPPPPAPPPPPPAPPRGATKSGTVPFVAGAAVAAMGLYLLW